VEDGAVITVCKGITNDTKQITTKKYSIPFFIAYLLLKIDLRQTLISSTKPISTSLNVIVCLEINVYILAFIFLFLK